MRKRARTSRKHRIIRAIPIAIVATVATSIGSAALFDAPASAGPLPSTTTLVTSSGAIVQGTTDSLTATVSVLGLPGLGITPTGTVAFSVGGTPLGTVGLGTCLLKTCTATLSTTALPVGVDTVTGTFLGDNFTSTSTGTTTVTVTAPPPPPPTDPGSSSVTCPAGQSCDSGTVIADDGTATLDVTSGSSSSSQTVTASLATGTLHCPGDTDPSSGGDLATFSSTATDAGKTITYNGFGVVGQQMENNYAAHTTFAGCYASPNPFNGYTNGVYGPAHQVVESDGTYYEAQLSSCANNGGAKPCFVNDNALALSPPYDRYTVQAGPGDPKLAP